MLPSPIAPAVRDPRRMMRPGLEDKAKRADFIREMISRDSGSVADRAKQADFENNMQNTGGFDASDLMKNPEMAQQSTRDQAEKVSEPYRQANIMAADKNNPMNAVSQDPGRAQLQDFIDRKLRDPRRRGDGSEDMAGM